MDDTIIGGERLFDLGFDQLRHQDEAINAADMKLGVILGFAAAAIAEILGLLILGLIEAPNSTHFTCIEKCSLFGGIFTSFGAGIASLIGIGMRGDVRPFSLAGASGKTFRAFIGELEKDVETRQSRIKRKTKCLWVSSILFTCAIALWAACAVSVVLHLEGPLSH